MYNLFKKAALFTDIHFGLKSNSQLHNEDCLNFIKWATAKAKEEGCETGFFLGDWHNHRARHVFARLMPQGRGQVQLAIIGRAGHLGYGKAVLFQSRGNRIPHRANVCVLVF